MADSAIAIIESTSNLQSTSNMAALPSVSISADIQVENLALPMPITSSSVINRDNCNTGTSDDNNKLCDDGETAKKKRKLSNSNVIKKSLEINDKLENRLGGILSCAVCLDLPNHAIFQVIHRNIVYFLKNLVFMQ